MKKLLSALILTFAVVPSVYAVEPEDVDDSSRYETKEVDAEREIYQHYQESDPHTGQDQDVAPEKVDDSGADKQVPYQPVEYYQPSSSDDE